MTKTHAYLPLLLAVLMLPACDQLQSSLKPAAVPEGKVLATVNGEPITQPMLDVFMQQHAKQADHDPIDPHVALDQLINLELMRQEGVSKGVDTRPEISALLNQQERMIIAGAAMRHYLEESPVTEEEVQQAYDAETSKSVTEYNARHILTETREQAEQIITMLDLGADFGELAREKSTGPSAANAGKLGWFRPQQMEKAFADATAALEEGEYTKEPVQTKYGWHVILLEEKRTGTPPPYGRVKDRLSAVLANQKLQKHIQDIRASAVVKVDQD